MTTEIKTLSLCIFRYVLGVVILIESVIVAVNFQSVAESNHIGVPHQVVLGLAVAEAIGALLFILPWTLKIGSISLLLIFAAAAILHLLHGQYNVGDLLIFAAGTLAVMMNSGSAKQ